MTKEIQDLIEKLRTPEVSRVIIDIIAQAYRRSVPTLQDDFLGKDFEEDGITRKIIKKGRN